MNHKESSSRQPKTDEPDGGSGNYFLRNFFSVPRQSRGKFLNPQGPEENNFRVHRDGKIR